MQPDDEEIDPDLEKYFDPAGPRDRATAPVRKKRRIRMSEAETRAGAEGRPATVPTKPGGGSQ